VFKGQWSVASDLWAVGVMLHELLVGALPYPQDDFYALLLAITSDESVDLTSGVPDPLVPILQRALTKDPGKRFPCAAEMALALDEAARPVGPSVGASAAARAPAHNLPQQLTSFIGRERETADVQAMLASSRLVTITAAGGTGKSRLSVQVAQGLLSNYRDGVWLVELAAVTEPAHVAQTIARVLNVGEVADEPIVRTLVKALVPKQALLLLDNCEHLIGTCAEVATALLRDCGDIRVLASSREALNIAGESVYPIPPLSLPDPRRRHTLASLSQYDAVRLFLDRAGAVRPDFAVNNQNAAALAQLCFRLDGIPLALELAAARVRSLTVEEINSRLDNRFRLLTGGSRTALPRQQTLRALIDWSYDLLNGQEQLLLMRVSIFAGGWTLSAAERVCAGDGIDDWETLDLLTALSDKSLVICDMEGLEVRYRLLETLREYSREKLLASQTAGDVADRHAGYFADMVVEKFDGAAGGDGSDVAWAAIESDNIRTALDRLWTAANVETAARMTVHLREFWSRKGWLREAYSSLETGVQRIDAVADLSLGAAILKDAGWFAFLLGDLPTAEVYTIASVQRALRAGAREIQADALNGLALVAQSLGDAGRARDLFAEAIALVRADGRDAVLADYLVNLGFLESTQGQHDAAQAYFSEARSIYEAHSNERGMAAWLCNQSDLALRRSNWRDAQSFAEQSLERFRKIDNRLGIAYALANLAEAAARQDDHALTDASVREAVAICGDTNHQDLLPVLLMSQARSKLAQGRAGEAALLLAGVGRLRSILNSLLAGEEQREMTAIEQHLRSIDSGELLPRAQAQLSAAGAEEVLQVVAALV
jgi:predicted ATPase